MGDSGVRFAARQAARRRQYSVRRHRADRFRKAADAVIGALTGGWNWCRRVGKCRLPAARRFRPTVDNEAKAVWMRWELPIDCVAF
jgi:hypothetical protein